MCCVVLDVVCGRHVVCVCYMNMIKHVCILVVLYYMCVDYDICVWFGVVVYC